METGIFTHRPFHNFENVFPDILKLADVSPIFKKANSQPYLIADQLVFFTT